MTNLSDTSGSTLLLWSARTVFDMEGRTLLEIDAGAHACSVEWCPIPSLERYVACATYLLKTPQEAPLQQQEPNHSARALGAAGEEGRLNDGVDVDTEQGTEAQKVTPATAQTRTGTVVVHRVSGCSLAYLLHCFMY